VTRVANTFFVLVLTFYLMIEGDRAWRFLSRYFTPRLRYRMRRSYPEISRVVSGYVIGQSINSLAFGIFAFAVTFTLGVPEALLLGVLAAVFDAVPIVGVPVATIPAVLLALTVSWQTAAIVVVLYIVYQQFENYVMVPRVFGNTLQVSALSILVGVLIGGQLLGVIGIILSLPLTATIPVLERVWNEPLPDDIVAAEKAEAEAAAEHAEHPNGY
jgi:predicted PurR-regulated permease PerM